MEVRQWEAGERPEGQGVIWTRRKNAHFVSEEIENIILPPGAKVGVNFGGNKRACTLELERLVHLTPQCPPTTAAPGQGHPRQEPRRRSRLALPDKGPFSTHDRKRERRLSCAHNTHSVPFRLCACTSHYARSWKWYISGASEHFCPRSTILLQGRKQCGREL